MTQFTHIINYIVFKKRLQNLSNTPTTNLRNLCEILPKETEGYKREKNHQIKVEYRSQ